MDDLVVQWAYQFHPVPLRSEATPIVRDGVMYATAGGTMAFALDAATGRALWRYDYPFESGGTGRPPNWNRGFAISGQRLYMGTVDCHLLALDARTGSPLWKALITLEQPCFAATSAPLVVRNRVLIGVRGGDTGRLRGFLDAFDSETGERAWRFYTIPAPGEPGSETWPDTDAWKAGGGRAMDDGDLRSGSGPGVLADRESRPEGLRRPEPRGRQPVLGVRACHATGRWQACLALPVHPA